MIQEIRNIKIYSADEITNEQYHTETDHISGSALFEIFSDCPAAWKYADKQETPALLFGTAGHAGILESELFSKEYYRIPCADDFDADKLLKTDTEVKSYLKSVGYKGYTTLKGSDLYAAVNNCDPTLICLRDIKQLEADKHAGKTGLKASDYDSIQMMKQAVYGNGYGSYIHRALIEYSIFCEIMIDNEWYPVKIKPDILTSNGELIDYKTTTSAHPDEFSKQAHRSGYWFKMALQLDVLMAIDNSGENFAFISELPMLLAQCKKSPFIAQMYQMTDEQIEIGRGEYITALRTWKHCEENGYYAYGGGIRELDSPAWVK